MTILGVGALGLGVAGIAVGAVLGVVYFGKSSDAEDLFVACHCTEGSDKAAEVRKADADAATFGTISVLSLGLGAAFAATGVVILVVGSDGGEANQARVELRPGPGGAVLGGTF